MGLFRSDDEKAAAAAARVLLLRMPAKARREIMAGLGDEDAESLRVALRASRRELRSGTRTCDSCAAGDCRRCPGQGCACG